MSDKRGVVLSKGLDVANVQYHGWIHNSHRLGDPLPQQIAILRALPGLGDLLCAVPAWRALRAALPDAHISLISISGTEHIVARFRHYIDEMIVLPGFPGLPERRPLIDQFPTFLADMHKRHFDLALQMHGSGGVTNILTALLGARHNAGFYEPHAYCPDPERFLPHPTREHEVWRNLRLLEWLGVPLQGDYLEFPLWQEDWQALSAIEETQMLQPNTYVCMHPGASTEERRWPVDRFATVADALAEQGLQIVLTGGPQEVDLARSLAETMRATPINLAGRTSLGALAALLYGARLLICNDTGVSHLAAALELPSVVIFNHCDLHGWAPLNHERHRSLGNPDGVPVAAVLTEAEDLLQQAMSNAV